MQVSLHWRMKEQRYRLTAVRGDDGSTNLLNRPQFAQLEDKTVVEKIDKQEEQFVLIGK